MDEVFESDLERNREIERINSLTLQCWNDCCENPEKSREFFSDLCIDVFQDKYVQTNLQGLEKLDKEKSYIFAPNHPGVLDEHKIFFNEAHSLPYYIIYFDYLLTKETGKKVHFIVSDPIDPDYQKIITAMEYIMIPDANNGNSKTSEEIDRLNQQVKEYLEKGEHVAFFPEGRWNGTGNIGPLHKGLYHMMRNNPESPVIPARMDGFDDPYKKIDITLSSPEKYYSSQHDKYKNSVGSFVEEFRKKVFGIGLDFNLVNKLEKNSVLEEAS